MAQLDFIHKKQFVPSKIDLPILKRLIAAYKLWHEFLQHFPRTIRYTIGEKIDLLLLKIMGYAYNASHLKKQEKLPILQKISLYLDNIKFLVYVTWELKAVDDKKYARISEHLFEIGNMLGGWIKQQKQNSA